MTDLQLVRPTREHLAEYAEALARGWSADNVRGAAAAKDELAHIARDADAFLASLCDREAKGAPIAMPDGSFVPRLPGYRLWLWDGEFCGSIGFRWQPGTSALPGYTLGHVGYAVVPWKQRRGYATRALALLLPEARREGLAYIDITTDPENVASHRVILNNGGRLVGPFRRVPAFGDDALHLLFRIDL